MSDVPMATVPVSHHGQAPTAVHEGIPFTMVVSTGTNAVEQLLGRDYDRFEAMILTADEPVVLAQSREVASSAANQVASVPQPAGAYLPTLTWLPWRNCDEVWVAATSATPTRVSVVVSRRLPVEQPAIS